MTAPLSQTLPIRQLHLLSRAPLVGARGSCALKEACSLRVAAGSLLVMAVVACGPKPSQPTSKSAIQSPEASVVPSLTEVLPVQEAPKSTSSVQADLDAGLQARAQELVDRYPGKTALELLALPEVDDSLKASLRKLGDDHELQKQINQSVNFAALMKGGSGEPGTARFELDTSGYDAARKVRMLQAVLSEDPRQLVNFITGEIGEAVPELSYEGAERARNGVSIKITPQKQP